MAQPRPFSPVTPICGMLFSDPRFVGAARAGMERLLGPVVLQSPAWPFTLTEYYAAEMGPALTRMFWAFAPRDPTGLPDWKLASNALEAEIAAREDAVVARPVNLDPGYITGGRLVLASCKPLAHRIALRAGVFAELTLVYRDGLWREQPHTLADYRLAEYQVFFSRVRELHLSTLNGP